MQQLQVKNDENNKNESNNIINTLMNHIYVLNYVVIKFEREK